jgi:hypothetical protein
VAPVAGCFPPSLADQIIQFFSIIKVKKSTNKHKQQKMELELTQEETDLFGLLMAVVAESDCRTVVRVAGGWVRDKVSTPPPQSPLLYSFSLVLLFLIEPNSCWASGTEAVTLTWSWTTCQL